MGCGCYNRHPQQQHRHGQHTRHNGNEDFVRHGYGEEEVEEEGGGGHTMVVVTGVGIIVQGVYTTKPMPPMLKHLMGQ